MSAAKQKRMLDTGVRAPDFQLQSLQGGRVALRELLAAGPVVLAFFKTTCPVCQLTFPFLERIHQGRQDGSLSVYGISQDDPEDTRDFNQQFGITFPTLLDTEESGYPVSNSYGIAVVPSLFVIESDGAISRTIEGFSKTEIESLGRKAGINPFRPDERVPEAKAG